MKGKILTWREAALVFTPLLVLIVPFIATVSIPDYIWNPLVRARENARRASCQSNLKQIGLGMKQYSQDYDDKLPLNTMPQGWAQRLTVYTKSCPVMCCPSDPASAAMTPTWCPSSYWMNANCFDKWKRGASMKSFAQPSRTFLIGDGDRSVGFNNYALNQTTWKQSAPYASRHMDGANCLFGDGHVAPINVTAIEADKYVSPSKSSHTFRLK
jgi:prepilin-type processing-associated H-X9-DG protein